MSDNSTAMDKHNKEELREFFADLVENQGKRITDLAKNIGYSHTMLSRFIKDGYCSSQFLEAAAQFRASYLEQVKSVAEVAAGVEAIKRQSIEWRGEWDYIPTNDAVAVLGFVDEVWRLHEMGAILGHPGTGKTRGVQEYCKINPKAVYVRADVTMSSKELLLEIGEALGENLSYGSRRSMMRRIINRLREEPRILIIDEADLLAAGYTVNKMEILRSIYDETKPYGNALLLVGMPRLEAFLKKGPSLKENLSQFDSRMGLVLRMGGLKREEIEAILDKVNCTPGARQMLVNIIMKTSKGGIRQLTKILGRCLDLALENGDGVITDEIVREATRMLML
ncbi:AAA domain protein [Neomoorella glycerini]|uniref:AAA domain protein n=1 Tax=Neomoorella glycerini TaxID=55779 RepID=A0A6I5ZP31_9FIRM|nr:AAA family ATPase [Moorella glycerini]QGP91682.1 AAA domain protein [Moorella glycerini]